MTVPTLGLMWRSRQHPYMYFSCAGIEQCLANFSGGSASGHDVIDEGNALPGDGALLAYLKGVV